MRSAVFIPALFFVAASMCLRLSNWSEYSFRIDWTESPWLAAVLPATLLTAGVAIWLQGERRALARCFGGAGRAGAPWLLAPVAERCLREREERLADLAHELRGALALMHGEIAAAREGICPADGALLARLARDVAHLEQLAATLSSAGGAPRLLRPDKLAAVALEACIRDVAERFRPALEHRAICWQLAYDTDCRMSGDALALAQLFVNLMSNTLRHADAGCCLQVRVRRTGSMLRVRWEDSGPGVDEAHLHNLGQRGFRVRPEMPGSGRGLAISRAIVEAHGGCMHFALGDLGGLAVDIDLPRRLRA